MAKDIELNYKIIKKLQDISDYFERWQRIKAVYKPKLDSFTAPSNILYITHNYSNHCVNIYRIFEQILLPKFSVKKYFTIENLFILNVSVILHDYIMITDPEKRRVHSEEGKKYIVKKVFENDSFLQNSLIQKEAECVADVVFGHSDIKFKLGDNISTIDLLPDYDFPSGESGPINTKLLSALLRIADELDINNDRIKNMHHFEDKIQELHNKYLMDKSEGKEINSEGDPLTHWNKCKILHFPQINKDDNRIINMVLNDEAIQTRSYYENDINLAIEVRNKIQKELDTLNDKVFSKGWIKNWTYNRIEIMTREDEYKRLISKILNPLDSSNIPNIDTKEFKNYENIENIKSNNDSTSDNIIKLYDKKYEEILSDIVYKEKLFESGHYYIDKEIHSKDWINTIKLLNNRDYLNEISDIFIKIIKSEISNIDDIFILGESYPGIILSSTLGFTLGYPFSYVIPEKDFEYHVDTEKDIKIDEKYKIILITDVIVRADTVNRITEWLKDKNVNNEIIKILTIFYRKPFYKNPGNKIDDKNIKNIMNLTISLCNSFPIELCDDVGYCRLKEKGIVKVKYEPI